MKKTKRCDMKPTAAWVGITLLVLTGLMITGCTYSEWPPPQYVEYIEPEPYYYDGPFAQLSLWGEWIQTGPFGWVWRPYVGTRWQPY